MDNGTEGGAGSASPPPSLFFPLGDVAPPDWLIYAYFVFVASGSVVAGLQAAFLMAERKTGSLCLMLQLCLSDIFSLYVATIEILTLYYKTWIFSLDVCMFFKGMEIFANSLTAYTIICIGFHVISLANLQKFQRLVNSRNPLTCITDSDECLVTKNENRTLNINYLRKKTDISIILPAILTWLVSTSLSIPNFTLSTIFNINNTSKCAIVYHYYGALLYNLLLVFRCVIPVVLIFLLFQILIVKLIKVLKLEVNTLTIDNSEIKSLLVFGILLTFGFMITSFQRYVLYFAVTIRNRNNFHFPVTQNVDINTYSNIYLSMIHYSGICLRANLYLFMLPNFLKICSKISLLRNNKV